ncbi:hypothetical protein [Amycolatopsis sp. 195334CR]|uniref:hypothetical protein n=1 Tax=Amycolatopsis sp. 195334CR TaxID=2814588 RepID=UPI001A8D743C|nr:hypothetical protein [Amycolatopsis sp. 195334CR]MBN6041184.1 hypothetical protein [Amycolatopsis sp. 195334CR]
MRLGPRLLTALLIALGLGVSACGSADAPDPKPNLLKEYWASPAVKNDRLPGYGAAPEDRQANLAAFYNPDQLLSRLLSVFPCSDESASRGGGHFDTTCDLTSEVRGAVQEAGGDPQAISGRVALVKHSDGELELMTLFLANGKVVDATGETHSGLDEFRDNNDLLDADDVMLVPSDLTKTDGENQLVTVYGHTPWGGWPWLVGGAGALVLLLLFWLLRRSRHP